MERLTKIILVLVGLVNFVPVTFEIRLSMFWQWMSRPTRLGSRMRAALFVIAQFFRMTHSLFPCPPSLRLLFSLPSLPFPSPMTMLLCGGGDDPWDQLDAFVSVNTHIISFLLNA